ncbi:MAG: HDOD domain-containing protein [Thermodesulfobacteriota bacterium]|nr:HDOD domain-containing protein [Thermodesulfobacteriota bacterium]
MDRAAFLKEIDHIPDLPTLPVVAAKVNRMLQDDTVSVKQVSETLKKDQAMVSKILKLVNSAFYGFRSKITTIPHAITILGFNTVRNAVVAISVIDALSGKDPLEGFDITDFWRHSVAVAVTGRNLAEKTRLTTPDEAFVAGILHDLGKVLLAQYFKGLFAEVWTRMRDNGLSFYEAENKLLPVAHPQIGGHLAQKWHLPPDLVRGISYHHSVNECAGNLNLPMIVHVCDYIVNNYKPEVEENLDSSGLCPEAARTMASQLDTLPEWFPAVAREIEEGCEFFVARSG